MQSEYEAGMVNIPPNDSFDSVSAVVDIQLLIEALLGFTTLFFQIASFTSAYELHKRLGEANETTLHIFEILSIVESKDIEASRENDDAMGASIRHGKNSYSYGLGERNSLAHGRFSPWSHAEWLWEIRDRARVSAGQSQKQLDTQKMSALSSVLRQREQLKTRRKTRQQQQGSYNYAADRANELEYLNVVMEFYRKWVIRRAFNNQLTLNEKMLISWGLIVGIIFIYIKGTYVLFSGWVGDNSSPSWILLFWRKMGKLDTRYNTSNDFLVSTEGFLAVFVGPLALSYSWAVAVSSPYRHIFGVITSSADLYALLMTLAIEIRIRFKDFSTDNLTLFVLLFVVLNFIRACASLYVLCQECKLILEKSYFYNIHKAELALKSIGS